MRANGNFGEVTAKQGGAGGLKPGGYACLITEVIDGTEESSPYLGLVLNVLDPKTKKMMFTQDLADPEQWWKHTFRYYVSAFDQPGIDWGRYKALVEAVEGTRQNNGFKYQDIDGGERQLVGKWVGCVFRRYLYVPKRGKRAGEQRDGIELSFVLNADDAIEGNFDQKLVETRDGRPDELKGTPYPPEQKVVHAPASAASTPESAVPAPTATVVPELYDEPIPF